MSSRVRVSELTELTFDLGKMVTWSRSGQLGDPHINKQDPRKKAIAAANSQSTFFRTCGSDRLLYLPMFEKLFPTQEQA